MSLSRWMVGRRIRWLLDEAESDLARGTLPEAVAARSAVPVGPVARPVALRRLHSVAAEILLERGTKDVCLVRAVALLGEARRLGFDAALACGVRKRDDRVEAHAWLTVAGRPLLDEPQMVATYEPLTVLPREEASA